MKKLLEYLTKTITDSRDIKIEESTSDNLQVYHIKAPKEVMGLLIGKEGKTIRAMRVLARARAIIDKQHIALQISEI